MLAEGVGWSGVRCGGPCGEGEGVSWNPSQVDPLTAHPHEPDIQGLLRVCNVHEVPAATNVAAAAILVRSLSAPRSRL